MLPGPSLFCQFLGGLGEGLALQVPPERERAQYEPRLRALAVYLVEAQFVPFGRTQQLLADLIGVWLARGTVVGWVQQAAHTLKPVKAAITAALVRAQVLHNDESDTARNTRQ